MSWRARAVLAALPLALAAALHAAGPEKPAPPAGAERPPVRVTTAVAEGRAVQRGVETVGSLSAWDEVVVRSQVSGTVIRLHGDLGDGVRAGGPLAELDRREADLGLDQLRADLGAARDNLARARAAADASQASLQRVRDGRRTLEAELARARADGEWRRLEFERARELAAKELIAARDVDNARIQAQMSEAQVQMAETTLAQHPDQVRSAEAQLAADRGAIQAAEAQVRQRQAALELGQKRLGDTTVPAPFSGVVARRHVTPGEFVKDNTPLYTLVSTDPLKYTGTVPERFAPELRIGLEVLLEVDAFPGRTFPGRVTRIAPVVDVPTRTLALEARVPNGPGVLKPGFFARGRVQTRQDARVAFVPAEALSYTAGLTKAFVIAAGRARERQVKVGARQGGWVEVTDGIRPGETVATSGLAQLFDGAGVAVSSASPDPAATPGSPLPGPGGSPLPARR